MSQSVTWGPASPPGQATNLITYTGTGTATFEFTNGATPLSNATMEVELATGVEYIAGTLVATTSASATVTENSSTGDNIALFTIGSLATGESVLFTFGRQASCMARTHKEQGGTFSDICHVFENGTELTYTNNNGSPYSADYDVFSANLVLGTVAQTPGSSTVVGATINRALTIINGSFGEADEFWYKDDHTTANLSITNILINNAPIPASNITNTLTNLEIHFDAALIALIDGSMTTVGNGNSLFERDEFFNLSYDITPLNCGVNYAIPSNLSVFYGPDILNECAPSGNGSTSITIENGTPEVVISGAVNPRVDFCGSTTHSVTYTNNGTSLEDFAKDITFFIGLRQNSSFLSTHNNVSMWGGSRFGVKNFSNITIGGNVIVAPQIGGLANTSIDYIPHDYFTSDPDGSGGLEDLDGDGFFDDLGPGDSVTIGFDITIIPLTVACGNSPATQYIMWEHISIDGAWLNQCGDLQTPKRQEFSYVNQIRNSSNSTFVDGPTDIQDGGNFEVTIKPHLATSVFCNGENGSTGADVSWLVKAILPPGVSLQPGATTDATLANYNPSIYQSNDTVYYTINRYIYRYFTFPLVMDCSLWDGTTPFAIDFVTTYDCAGCYVQDIHCESIEIVPHCPSNCAGITTDGFTAERTTAGWTDNTKSTPVILTKGIHAIDKILPFDTIRITAKGHVSDTLSDNLYLRMKYSPESEDDIFDYVSGSITIYDLDGGTGNIKKTFPITTSPIVTSPVTGSYVWQFDLSGYLALVGPAFTLGSGMLSDSFEVNLNAIYNTNSNQLYYEVNDFRSDFFMFNATNDTLSCDNYGTRMGYTGFAVLGGGQTITMQGCNAHTTRGFSTWANYSGDIFPSEYRPIQQIDSIIWSFPDGVDVLGAGQSQLACTVSYHYNNLGEVVVTPNSDYFPADWRSTYYPGFFLEVNGSCELYEGVSFGKIRIYRTLYNYHPNPAVHEINIKIDNNDPRITYVKPDVILTPEAQIQQGITDTVKWDIDVCNGSGGLGVNFGWVTFDESTSNGITITNVYDISTGVEVPVSTTNLGGSLEMIPIGDILGGDCKTLRLVGTYSDCSADSISIDMGWNCIDYPTDLMDLNNCDANTFLSVVPLIAQMDATLTSLSASPVDPMDPAAGNYNNNEISMCETFPVELTILSSGLGSVFDINLDLSVPGLGNGIMYVANSATIEVEGIDAPNTPRPIDATGETILTSNTSSTINIQLSDLDNANFGLGIGLAGAATNPAGNEVTIRWLMESTCDFTSGEQIKIQTFGNAACADVAQGAGQITSTGALNVDGVVLPYAALLTTSFLSSSSFVGCQAEENLALEVYVSGGTTGLTDSMFITLPEGLSYAGTQNCTSAKCPVYLGMQMSSGQEVLVFSYPPGVSNETMTFDIDVISNYAVTCTSSEIDIKSTVNVGGVSCGTGTCPSVKVIAGAKTESINTDKPDLTISFSSIVYNENTDEFSYDLTIINDGADSDSSTIVDIYCMDANGNPDLAGGAMGTLQIPILTSNQILTLTGSFTAAGCDANNGIYAAINPTASTGTQNCICESNDTQFTNIDFGVQINIKVQLEGPYDASTSLCTDNLRTSNLIPTTEPYSALGFQHYFRGGGEIVDPSVFTTTGQNAIVDWIFVELRDPTSFTTIVATRAALLQADGNVVDVNGDSFVFFAGVAAGNYYIVVRHRNHLAIMTPGAIPLSNSTAYLHDFTTGSAYGVLSNLNVQKSIAPGKFGMFEGDLDQTGLINAADRSIAWNFRNLTGYAQQDSNFDGVCNASERSIVWNNRNLSSQVP